VIAPVIEKPVIAQVVEKPIIEKPVVKQIIEKLDEPNTTSLISEKPIQPIN
jgi:hypothetical protein